MTIHLPDGIESFAVLRTGSPAQARPCIDDARRWVGCQKAGCTFFANGEKQPGCVTFPHGGTPHHETPRKRPSENQAKAASAWVERKRAERQAKREAS